MTPEQAQEAKARVLPGQHLDSGPHLVIDRVIIQTAALDAARVDELVKLGVHLRGGGAGQLLGVDLLAVRGFLLQILGGFLRLERMCMVGGW